MLIVLYFIEQTTPNPRGTRYAISSTGTDPIDPVRPQSPRDEHGKRAGLRDASRRHRHREPSNISAQSAVEMPAHQPLLAEN